jgi:hypothetical protein
MYACLILCLKGILLGGIIIRNQSLFIKKLNQKDFHFGLFTPLSNVILDVLILTNFFDYEVM